MENWAESHSVSHLGVFCPSGDERELLVSKSEPKAVVEGFDRSKEYSVKITAVRGAEQSKALLGRYTGETLF